MMFLYVSPTPRIALSTSFDIYWARPLFVLPTIFHFLFFFTVSLLFYPICETDIYTRAYPSFLSSAFCLRTDFVRMTFIEKQLAHRSRSSLSCFGEEIETRQGKVMEQCDQQNRSRSRAEAEADPKSIKSADCVVTGSNSVYEVASTGRGVSYDEWT